MHLLLLEWWLGFKAWYALSWIRMGSNVSGCCGHDIESEGSIKGELSDSDIILPEDTSQFVYFKWLIDEKYRCKLLYPSPPSFNI